MTEGNPSQISTGKLMSVPPPATELMAAAANAATNAMDSCRRSGLATHVSLQYSRSMFSACRALASLLLCLPLIASDAYLFTSFRSNGETGVFLASSRDGKKWTPLNGNRPWIKPELPGMLMRDPFLVQGPDGVWQLIWTWAWTRDGKEGALRIGHSSSKDLLTWTPQHEVVLMEEEPQARNAWAPEAAWDDKTKEWIIFWATTIPGRFPDSEGTGDSGYNHRLYATRTRDWKTFTPAELWFDPGFNSIDSTSVKDGDRWVMIFKDERKNPLQKKLRLAFSKSPQGPWSAPTEPFTPAWVEGPSAIHIGSEWWIYFDYYTKPRHYGAMRTRDWKSFEDMTTQVTFPEDHRHGTVVRISAEMAAQLQRVTR